jgi:MFS family permease
MVRGAEPNRRFKRYTIFLFASVLAIDSADRATVGVAGDTLKKVFHLNNTKLGFLAAAFSIVGSLATIPVGILTDRVRRTRLMAISIAIWSATMAAAGAATSYLMLFTSRMFLGVAAATDGPTIASLTGDLYEVEDRGRVLGIIQSGTLVGVLLAFVLTGLVVDKAGWRWAFWMFIIPGVILAIATARLPEPERGAQERKRALARAAASSAASPAEAADGASSAEATLVTHPGDGLAAEPDPALVLVGDQSGMPVREVVKYLVRVRTNIICIVSGSVGNFFLAGISAFAVIFFRDEYHLSTAAAGAVTAVLAVGAVPGFLIGGWLGDHLLRKNIINGRIIVAAWSNILAGLCLWPAFALHNLVAGLPLFFFGGACITAPTPVMDAVRLDIVHPQLWGRAESFKTFIRIGAEAAAPLLFGVLADAIGLQPTILILVPALTASGMILLLALRTYPRDMASVLASTTHQPTIPGGAAGSAALDRATDSVTA